jgi:hypothetical protein
VSKPFLAELAIFFANTGDSATTNNESMTNKSYDIFLPYFGGNDDKLALNLVLQLCEKPNVTGTIVHISTPAGDSSDEYGQFSVAYLPTNDMPDGLTSRS